jgi:hypothetical protein
LTEKYTGAIATIWQRPEPALELGPFPSSQKDFRRAGAAFLKRSQAYHDQMRKHRNDVEHEIREVLTAEQAVKLTEMKGLHFPDSVWRRLVSRLTLAYLHANGREELPRPSNIATTHGLDIFVLRRFACRRRWLHPYAR